MSDDIFEGPDGGSNRRGFFDEAPVDVTADGADLDLQVALDALAIRRRRYLLYCLRDHETHLVADVAARIVAWEADVRDVEATDERLDRTLYAFCHDDLPRLADAGLVEYDRRRGTVRYADPPPRAFERLLRLCAELERSDHADRGSGTNEPVRYP